MSSMQTQGGSQSRVLWVIPPATKTDKLKKINNTRTDTIVQNRSRLDSDCSDKLQLDSNGDKSLRFNDHNNGTTNLSPAKQTTNSSIDQSIPDKQTSMDEGICRILCTIVEEYLKELKQHQRLINEARTKLVREMQHESEHSHFITHNDSARLKVRDEQTKAIETIKQLTNYLREISNLKAQTDSSEDPPVIEINSKISNVRNNIIQALNEFVISNNDIDVPILDPDDTSISDFDICAEVRRSSCNFGKVEVSQSSSADEHQQLSLNRVKSKAFKPKDGAAKSALIEVDDSVGISDCQLEVNASTNLIEFERRKREVQKLAKDTVELRKLFAHFYDLVKIQGEQVDTIENNIVAATHDVGEGAQHIEKSMKYLRFAVPAVGCVTGVLIGGPIGMVAGSKVASLSIVLTSSLVGLMSGIGAQKCMVHCTDPKIPRLKQD